MILQELFEHREKINLVFKSITYNGARSFGQVSASNLLDIIVFKVLSAFFSAVFF